MKKWRKAIENAPVWALFLSGTGALILTLFTIVSRSFMSDGSIPLSVVAGLVTLVVIPVVLFFLIKLKGAKEFQKKRRKQEKALLYLGYGLIFILSFLVFSHAYHILFVQKAEVDKNAEEYTSYLNELDKSYNEYVNVLRLNYKTEMENAIDSPNNNELLNFKEKYKINGELTHRTKNVYLNTFDDVMRGSAYGTAINNLNRLKRNLGHIKKIDGYVFIYPQKYDGFKNSIEKVVEKYEILSTGHKKGEENPFQYNGGDLSAFKDMSSPFNMLEGNIWLYIAFLVLQFLILSAYVFAKRPSSPPLPPGGLSRILMQSIVIDQGGIIVTK